MSCNLDENDLLVNGTEMTCGAAAFPIPNLITVTGSSDEHVIVIRNSVVTLELDSVELSGSAPIVAFASIVTFITHGNSFINCTLEESSGIGCVGNSSLTFLTRDNGHLTVLSAGNGIGPPGGERCTSLSFENGTFAVNTNGTGIGAGRAALGASEVELIAIHGGRFAIAAGDGAGIGSGAAIETSSVVKSLVINGGNFEPVSSRDGAGIGAGFAPSTSRNSQVNSLVLTGGVYDAFSESGAGIGTGWAFRGRSEIDNLVITGGNFSSRSNSGAGLGLGSSWEGTTLIRSLECLGGIVTARSKLGAGIGTGYVDGQGMSVLNTLRIRGMTITADSDASPGIGSGSAARGNTRLWSVIIEDGVIEATSRQGAGIGSGFADELAGSNVDTVEITGGIIRAVSSRGSGIGCGWLGNGSTGVTNIIISSGSVTAEGQIALGNDIHRIAKIELSPGANLVTLDLYSAADYAISALSIVCGEGQVRAITNSTRFFPPEKATNLSSLEFVGEYRGLSENESLSGKRPCLHIAQLPQFNVFPTLKIRQRESSYIKVVSFDRFPQPGFIVALGQTGEYIVDVASEPNHALEYNGSIWFELEAGDNFFEMAVVVETPETPEIPTPESSERSLSVGALVGIIVGVFLLVAVGIAAVFVVRRRSRSQTPEERREGLVLESPVSPTPV
jgi:hypothetical protein